jgi:hypothetical protein
MAARSQSVAVTILLGTNDTSRCTSSASGMFGVTVNIPKSQYRVQGVIDKKAEKSKQNH